jgi:two-component system, sensor histidine kinase RpfC
MSPQEPDKYPFTFGSARIARAPRPDLEQTPLRLLIAAMVLAYAAWHLTHNGIVTNDGQSALYVLLAFFAFSAAAVTATLFTPGSIKAWRVAGIVVDNAITTYGVIALGEGGAVLLGVYSFITLGNGFRYGRRYMILSQILSVSGFAFALVVSPFWSHHPGVGVGILMVLLVLPLYVGALAERLKAAVQQAQEAQRAKEAELDRLLARAKTDD